MRSRLGRLAALDVAWLVGVPLLAAAVLGPILGFAGWPDGPALDVPAVDLPPVTLPLPR